MDYLRQIQRGVDFIEAHLDQELDLVDVTREARVSHWHYQRMFKALTGQTLKGYIRARRLALAARQLRNGSKPVLELALEAGFESQASFTRAFKQAYGVPPGRFRTRGAAIPVVEQARIDEAYLRHLDGNVSLEPTIETHPRRRMIGLQTRFHGVESERNNIGARLPALWAEFLARLPEVDHAVPGVCYGVIQEVEPLSEGLSYFAAIEVRASDRIPDGLVEFEVPAARRAVFTHRGIPEAVDHTVDYIYGGWIHRARQRHGGGADLEIYDARWVANSPDSEMGYAIPLA